MRKLMSHQERAVEYAMSVQHPAFFMEMRLGKTLSAIRWVVSLDYPQRVLVVAPLTVLEAWKRELTMENEPHLDLHEVKTKQREQALVEEVLQSEHRVWVLTNYETLLRIPEISGVGVVPYTDSRGKRKTRYETTVQIPWDVVLLDESTKIKNPNSHITKICVRGFRRTKHRSILTGLPAPESEMELYSQFQFLHGRFMGCDNYWRFKDKYFQPSLYNAFDWQPKPGARREIKETMHAKAFVLRRTDVKMGSRKIFERRHVEMTPKQKSLYKQVTKDFAYQRDDESWNETQWAMTAEMWLQRLAGGFDPEGTEVLSEAKANEILNLLKTELQGDQAVVWFRFRSEVDLTRKVLESAGIRCVVIDGGVKQADREEVLRVFRSKKVRVLLATEKCAKMGVDCSTADCAIYYSNEWSCDDRLQSEDRIVHPAKTVPLLYIDLVTKGTVDQDVVERIRDKSFNAKEIMMKHMRGIQWAK